LTLLLLLSGSRWRECADLFEDVAERIDLLVATIFYFYEFLKLFHLDQFQLGADRQKDLLLMAVLELRREKTFFRD
jgi:hypothetical protein